MDADESRSNGEAQVFDRESTLASHAQWLRTVAYSRLNSWDAVDDVMQEVAIACSRQERLAQRNGTSGGWLYTVTVWQALLYRRQMGRQRRRLEKHCLTSTFTDNDRSTNPLDIVLAAEEAAFVQAAMRRLCPRDRELLLLKYTEEWSCQDLAEHLGSTASAIENRLYRARQRLRKLLAQYNVKGNEQ